MYDQRVVGGAALGRKNFCHRRVVTSVGGQAVHRLGGQAEQLAVTQRLRRLGDVGLVGTQDHGGL